MRSLANESYQNSAALKNITINTGTTKFNTAIEYDTDHNHTAYSRVKHYIVNGKAYSYEYDAAGNISKIQNPDGSWAGYTYDALNQLIGENYSSGDTITYVYDTRGNIFTKTINGVAIEYSYTDTTWKDRLTSYNGNAISYDTIGNPLNWINGETLTWQHGRQLASYTKNGSTISFVYNDEGIRTSKTVGDIKTDYYIYNGVLRRLTTSDGDILQFVYGNDLSSVIYNGTEYWYVFNAQGDVIGLIDSLGEYVVKYTYDSWGKPLSKTGILSDSLGTLNPYRYRRYIYDEETGFYYCQSRYYDSEIGRWLNADCYTSTGVGMLGHHMYAYCNNRPLVFFDPVGTTVYYVMTGFEGHLIGGGGTAVGFMWDDCGNFSFFEAYIDVYSLGFGAGIALTAGYNTHYDSIGAFVINADGNPHNDDNPYFAFNTPSLMNVSFEWSTGIADQIEGANEGAVGWGCGGQLFKEVWTQFRLTGDVEKIAQSMMHCAVSDCSCGITTSDIYRFIKEYM